MITKEKFFEVYNKYLPKKWIVFAYKYFSKETEKKNMKLNNTIIFLLAISFLIGMVGTIAHWPRVVIMWATLGYAALLTVLVLFLFAATQANNFRIRKIAKELGCSLSEYNKLADEYFKEQISVKK